MLTNTLTYKREAEIHDFAPDFSRQLAVGESIVEGSWVVTVIVDSGADPNPAGILLGLPTLSGNVVHQKVQQGIVGAIYRVQIEVQTSQEHTLSQDGKIAILPNQYPADGVTVTLFEESRQYPYLASDTIHLAGTMPMSAEIHRILRDYSFGDSTILLAAGMKSAEIRSIVQHYSLAETSRIDQASVISCNITTVVITYAMSDTFHDHAEPVSAQIKTVVIGYSLFTDTSRLAGAYPTAATIVTGS